MLSNLGRTAAEMLVLLVTGAALPDEGTVRILGRDTRDISTDTEWLASLDRIGLVSERAVLLDGLPVAANLALPLTLAIDLMSDETRARVEAFALAVDLPADRLDAPAGSLRPDDRVRVHLARALALEPQMLLFEHATASVSDRSARAAIGRAVRAAADRLGIGWIAIGDDPDFARASGSRRVTLAEGTGELREAGRWRLWR
jgi:ABC-type methionine transport system ATPase subunit